MQAVSTLDAYYTHTVLPNKIHEVTFTKPGTPPMVEQLMSELDQLYSETPKEVTVLELFKVLTKMDQVAYSMKRAREMLARHPDTKIRGAVVWKNDLATSILAPSMNLLRSPKIKFQFFRMEQYDDAIAWLLAGA